MMKRTLALLLGVILCSKLMNAQEADSKSKLGIYTEISVMSKSIWHGWDINEDKAAYHPYIGVDLWQSGFELLFWASLPVDRELKVSDDYEVFLKYGGVKFKDSPWKLSYSAFADYIRCPNNDNFSYKYGNKGTKQLWKFNAGFSFDQLISVGENNLVPRFNWYYITPAGDADFKSGSVFDFSFNYKANLFEKVSISNSVMTIYHSGVFGVTDWGAVVAGSRITKSFNNNLGVFVAANYQWSLSDSVNNENEFWGGAGIYYLF